MLRVVLRLASSWVALRLNPRGAGLDYRADNFLRAVQDLYLELVRYYWARSRQERHARNESTTYLDDIEVGASGGEPVLHHRHPTRIPQPTRPTNLSDYRIRRGLQRSERPGNPDSTDPNGPPEAA